MEAGKRVAIYARVSTADQTSENQLLDLRKYSAARGWTVVEEFVDDGFSGAKKERPDLSRLMAAARKQLVDHVLVWKFDRFARSLSHLVAALAEFQGRGIGFTSYTESIDTATPQGKMVFGVIAAMAEFERDIITERIHAGIRRARSQGKRLGRPGIPEHKVAAILELRGKATQREIAARVGVGKGVVWQVLRTASQAAPVNPLSNVA